MMETPAGIGSMTQNYQTENLKKSPANEQHAQQRSLSAHPVTSDFTSSRVDSWETRETNTD